MTAPGMQKGDFQIQLNGNTLTISSQRQHRDQTSRDGYSLREFSYESFQRTFLLPKDVVNDDAIAAKYENGVLLLRIPKRE